MGGPGCKNVLRDSYKLSLWTHSRKVMGSSIENSKGTDSHPGVIDRVDIGLAAPPTRARVVEELLNGIQYCVTRWASDSWPRWGIETNG